MHTLQLGCNKSQDKDEFLDRILTECNTFLEEKSIGGIIKGHRRLDPEFTIAIKITREQALGVAQFVRTLLEKSNDTVDLNKCDVFINKFDNSEEARNKEQKRLEEINRQKAEFEEGHNYNTAQKKQEGIKSYNAKVIAALGDRIDALDKSRDKTDSTFLIGFDTKVQRRNALIQLKSEAEDISKKGELINIRDLVQALSQHETHKTGLASTTSGIGKYVGKKSKLEELLKDIDKIPKPSDQSSSATLKKSGKK